MQNVLRLRVCRRASAVVSRPSRDRCKRLVLTGGDILCGIAVVGDGIGSIKNEAGLVLLCVGESSGRHGADEEEGPEELGEVHGG